MPNVPSIKNSVFQMFLNILVFSIFWHLHITRISNGNIQTEKKGNQSFATLIRDVICHLPLRGSEWRGYPSPVREENGWFGEGYKAKTYVLENRECQPKNWIHEEKAQSHKCQPQGRKKIKTSWQQSLNFLQKCVILIQFQ